jgi:hypothetical protein
MTGCSKGRRGRPPVASAARKGVYVQIRCDVALKAALQARAHAEGDDLSTWARDVLIRALADND